MPTLKQSAIGRMRRVAILAFVIALLLGPLAIPSSAAPPQQTPGRAVGIVSLKGTGSRHDGNSSLALSVGRNVSDDGRFVVFSATPSMVPGDAGPSTGTNIYLRDLVMGTTEVISKSFTDTPSNGASFAPVISGDGRYVAFTSTATNLVPAADQNGVASDVFVFDRSNRSIVLASVSTDGTQGNCDSAWPSLSADGRYLAFNSCATNWPEVAGKTLAVPDIFVRDLQAGITVWANPPAVPGVFHQNESKGPSLSANGRFVAYESRSNTILPVIPSREVGRRAVYLRDTCFGAPAGCVPSSEWISVSGFPVENTGDAFRPSMNADGRYVAFESSLPDLVPGDTNGVGTFGPNLSLGRDVFVLDRNTRIMLRVNVNGAGGEAFLVDRNSQVIQGCPSAHASISGAGRFVAFESCANNLDSSIAPHFDLSQVILSNIYLRDRDVDGNGAFDEPGGVSTILVSRSPAGIEANSHSNNPFISADGNVIAFSSLASDLLPLPLVTHLTDIYVSAPTGISVDDVSTVEGHAGSTNLTFTVKLFPPSTLTVLVDFATADGTAAVGSDYVVNGGTLTFLPGETFKQVTVSVSGDALIEPDESFFLHLSNGTNATIWKPQGVGTIQNDDTTPPLTISVDDVQLGEGNSGTTQLTFTVSLSAPNANPVTVDFSTADGTATIADNDYAAKSGTLTFTPGQTTLTITIDVTGDTTFEPDETFVVDLANPSGATIGKAQGLGTIQNDDSNTVTINIQENISVTDAPGLLPSAMLAISESITVTDAPGLLPSAMIGINETINVTDAPAPLPSAMLNINEAITVTDAPGASIGNTLTGPNIVVLPVDLATGATPVTVTFASVTQAGNTTLVMGPTGPPPPTGYVPGTPPLYHDVSTTAVYTPPVQVCVRYAGIVFSGSPTLWHFENGAWVNITTSVDAANQVVCGNSTSLSPFALFEPAQDQQAPEVQCAGPDGQWHVSDVALPCTAVDAGSGLANPADASFTLSTNVPAGTETGNAVTGSRQICDAAGNCATAGPIGGNQVDKKAPIITLTSPAEGATYVLHQAANAAYSCGDSGSGVGSCAGAVAHGAAVDTSSVGAKTFQVTATDAAGNSTSLAHHYAVRYNFVGFLPPVDNLPVTNTVKSGRKVPVKWRLLSADGASISDLASFTSLLVAPIACDPAPTDVVAQQFEVHGDDDDHGDTAVRYDPVARQFIFNWKTRKGWTGCRLLQLTLRDGTVHSAMFKFKNKSSKSHDESEEGPEE